MKKYTIPKIPKNIHLFIIQPKINKNKKELKEVQSSFITKHTTEELWP